MATLQVGRIVVSESEIRNLSEKPSGSFFKSIEIDGIETTANKTISEIRSKVSDVVAASGTMIPVVFEAKPAWDGYYVVSSSDATLVDWPSQGAAACEWKFSLDLLGTANDIDLESRLGGPASLLNDHATIGERWHAPPGGATAYWSGGSQPAQVVRTGADGPIKVYRSLLPGVNPRWNCPVSLYGLGRARFTDALGLERTGTSFKLPAVGWSASNSLLRISPANDTTTFRVESHDGTNWESKLWSLRYNGVTLLQPTAVTVLRNDYEEVRMRCLWNVTPSGRVTADITLRRGSRFAEVYLKSMLSGSLEFDVSGIEAATAGAGFIAATANDAAGNRYTAGSSKSYVADLPTGRISKSATLVMDGYVGAVVGGGAALAGDTGDVLFKQFIGAPTERVIGVKL